MISGLFDSLEKLINEHGSATVLRERIAFLKDQFTSLEKQLVECRNEAVSLNKKISELHSENQSLKLENRTLNEQIKSFHDLNPDGYRCHDCNSLKLKRTGSRPHKTFGDMGAIDAFFTCLDCGKESVIMIDTFK